MNSFSRIKGKVLDITEKDILAIARENDINNPSGIMKMGGRMLALIIIRIYRPSLISALSASFFCDDFCLNELKLYDTPNQSILLLLRLIFLRSNMLLCEDTSHWAVLNTSVRSAETVIAPFISFCLTPTFI